MSDQIASPKHTRLLTIISVVLSLVMAVVVGRTLIALDWDEIGGLLPASPLFWLAFAAFYVSAPVGDWLAFRQIWPVGKGALAATSRKQIYNEIVLGYLGEAYFYTWAKRRVPEYHGTTPFSGVKDVAILSAFAGNATMIALLAMLWPQMGDDLLASGRGEIFWSLALIMAISVVIVLARRQVFSLSWPKMWTVFVIHLARNIAKVLLAGLMWSLIVPDVPLVWWLYLATLRQLVTRLPLVSNKDLIFAGLAVLLLPDQPMIAATMALTAALLVAAHVAVAIVLLRGDVVSLVKSARARRSETL